MPIPPPSRSEALAQLRSRKLCIKLLLAALKHAGSLGDHNVCANLHAIILRFAKRTEHPAEREAIQAQGLERAVAAIDHWQNDPEDDRSLHDMLREAFSIGVNTGVDSVMPEWSALWLKCIDSTDQSPS